MGEVLTQVWLKSIKKRVSYVFDKDVNVQKESLKKLLGFTQAPASPRRNVQ